MEKKAILLDNEYLEIELENVILIGTFKTESVDIEMAHKITNYRLRVQNGEVHPILSNIKAIRIISKQARDFLASEQGCKGVIAAAILIDSSIGRIIGNFFITLSKPLRPTKIFIDETKAKEWLAKYV